MTSIERVAAEVAEQFAPTMIGPRPSADPHPPARLNLEHFDVYRKVLDVLKRSESTGLIVFRDTRADFLMRAAPRRFRRADDK